MKKLLFGLLSLSFTLQITSMEIVYDTPPPATLRGPNWTTEDYKKFAQDFPKEKLLFDAIVKNDLEQVRELLEQGAKVNQKSWFHKTALLVAVNASNIPICKLLRSYGADTNYKLFAEYEKDQPLWSIAMRGGDSELFDLLYDQKKVVTLLCCLRQMKKEKNLFATVFYNNAAHFIKPYFKYHFRSLNEKIHGGTALMRAAWAGDVEVCQLLIKHGADVNVRCSYGPDEKPQTALSLAGQRFAAFAPNYNPHWTDLQQSYSAKQYSRLQEIRNLLIAHGAI